MTFKIRQAEPTDREDLFRLATSLSAQGFLTLPSDPSGLERLIENSRKSFQGEWQDPDSGEYLFVLRDEGEKRVVGCSLILARHGTRQSPHIYFEVDSLKKTLQLQWETHGRTELGGLILDQGYRGQPEKLGKSLSLIRLLYIGRHRDRFRDEILAELLPPLTPDRKSPLWEAIGYRCTGMSYPEADRRSRLDKGFVAEKFPRGEIPIESLPQEAQRAIGQVGPETAPVAKILQGVGFRYLNQVDPFDGGPHFGARLAEIRFDLVESFFMDRPNIEWGFEGK